MLPEAINGTIRQVVALLDHAIKMRMPDLAHAFQPMLRLFDDYAIKILSLKLSPHIPARERERRDFFNPYLGAVDYHMRTPLERNQRYLLQNLIHGRPIQKLGTLLFCLDHAQQGGLGVAGVWKAVANVFAAAGMKDLYDDLKKVNEIRKQHIAHSEAPLDDPDKAVEAMGDWVRCINRMAKIANPL